MTTTHEPLTPLEIELFSIPTNLRDIPQWGAWRYERQDGKLKKPAFCTKTRKLSPSQPATWLPLADALDLVTTPGNGFEGLGFCFGGLAPTCGIDFDRCRNKETGALAPVERQLIKRLNSYSEVSPSGTGAHTLVNAKLAGRGKRGAGIEVYCEGRYFTVTGDHLPGTPTTIEERQAVVDRLLKAMPIIDKLRADDTKRARFEALFLGDITAYDQDDSRADLALCSLAAWAGATEEQIDALMRLSGLYRDKWERPDYRASTIAKARTHTGEAPQVGVSTGGGGSPSAEGEPQKGAWATALEALGEETLRLLSDSEDAEDIEGTNEPLEAVQDTSTNPATVGKEPPTPPTTGTAPGPILDKPIGVPSSEKTPQKPSSTGGGGWRVQSARDLMEEPIIPLRWVVRGLIPEGLTLLAGGVKLGKSMAALAIGLAVASGTHAFTFFDCEQGPVLYLALEDNKRRMQGRLDRVWGDREGPEELFFGYRGVPKMPELLTALKEWMQGSPTTRLIIIDTWGKVQERVRGNHNAYLTDYDAMIPLQEFALAYRVAVLAITHTNQKDTKALSDSLHRVQGTTGLIGCADSILLLDRPRCGNGRGTLELTGRDTKEGIFDIAWDNGIWTVTGRHVSSGPGPRPTERERAKEFLKGILASGAQPATMITATAEKEGIKGMTLTRAKRDLKIETYQQNGSWFWRVV